MFQHNFSWVIEKQLAGVRGPTDYEDLVFLNEKGVRSLVRLAEEQKAKVTAKQVSDAGLEDFHVPVKDYHPPSSMTQMDMIAEFVKGKLRQGMNVAVSCGAGCGRTGTVLTCCLISMGKSLKEAEEIMIKAGRSMYDTEGQHQFIIDYLKRTKRRFARAISGETVEKT